MISELVPVLDPASSTGLPVNTAPDLSTQPAGFLEWYRALHEHFTPWQQRLLRSRRERLDAALEGILPNHRGPSTATRSDWKISLPDWCRDQRNQMTGPADDGELVVKMLNSGAPGVMIDLEDSMANAWENTERGIANVHTALNGTLTYFDRKRGREIAIEPSNTVLMVRVRGLHLAQKLTGLDAEYDRRKRSDSDLHDLTSASLYDVARVTFELEASELKHPLTFYIPKSESAAEAEWWNELFETIADLKGWDRDYIKCFALVESHPLAYEIEEFLYGLRNHILGLNLGRWDYMASLIHFNLSDPEWVLPDRNTIPHDVAFFQRLRLLIPNLCHKRGALAIGGMTALFPDRANPEFNGRALQALAQDKRNEAVCGMDGAWTGHPDQNTIAVAQFPEPNQLDAIPDSPRYPDLRPSVSGIGGLSLQGTRAAVRTVIRYRNGVLNRKGASLLDGYMEDLATDRIYRLMLAQRLRHREHVEVLDDRGRAVKHTPQLLSRIFDEECSKLVRDPAMLQLGTHDSYRAARQISEAMILNEEFDPR